MASIIDSYPKFPDVCLSENGYTGIQDYDNEYLGTDRHLPMFATVSLTASLDNAGEVEALMLWWKDEINRGTGIFIIASTFFGKRSKYGVRLITPFTHAIKTANEVSFKVEILFDEAFLDNEPPIALPDKLFIQESSRDNYVVLNGVDPEGDPLKYTIILPPAEGTLSGTPPNLLYTPRAGYVGSDCFNFIVSDRQNSSQYAVMEIEIGGALHPEAEFEYIMLDHPTDTDEQGAALGQGMRVSGSYYYREGRGAEHTVKRGTGGMVRPLTADKTLYIWSNNHKIDKRDDTVLSCKVNNWGKRTNYADFFEDKASMAGFTVANAIGSCKGTVFDNMFKGVNFVPPLFDTGAGFSFKGTFESANFDFLADYDFAEAIYLSRIFKLSAIRFFGDVNSAKGQYFDDAFNGSNLFCMAKLDTSKQLNTRGMFDNLQQATPNPGTADQDLIKNGLAWVNTGSACGVEVIDVTGNSETCEITSIGGTCSTTGTYTVNTKNAAGALTYDWQVGQGQGTIVGGIKDQPSISVTAILGIDGGVVDVRCTVTDATAGKVVTTSWYSFSHNRTAGYAVITLAAATTPIYLETEIIAAEGAAFAGEVQITNNRVNPTIFSGDLTKYAKVTLVNTSWIQAFSRSDGNLTLGWEGGALQVTTVPQDGKLHVDNRGVIAGCGGRGGNGGIGKATTYTTNHSEKEAPVWTTGGIIGRSCWNVTHISWKGTTINVTGAMDTSRSYRVGSTDIWWGGRKGTGTESPSGDACDGTTVYLDYSERRWTTTHNRTGGTGGTGGRGLGFGVGAEANWDYNDAWRYGKAGGASNPTGGYSGGRGGYGGWWGNPGRQGYKGGGQSTENGAAEFAAGKSVIGDAKIQWINNGTEYGGKT